MFEELFIFNAEPNFEDDFNDVRMFGHRVTSSIEIPLSTLSDKEPELAALSAMSSVSDRDLASPDLRASSHSDEEADRNTADVVKVIDKERSTEIVVDVGKKQHEAEAKAEAKAAKSDKDELDTHRELPTSASARPRDSFFPVEADNVENDYLPDKGPEDEIYWSSSDYEEEDELMQLKSASFDDDVDAVDPATGTHRLKMSFPAFENKELAPEKKAPASAGVGESGKMDERLHGKVTSSQEAVAEYDVGSVVDELVTEDTVELERSNAGLAHDMEPEREPGDDYADDIPAEIRETPSYLEREYGVPILTPLDRDHELDEGLRGEGPSVQQNKSAARLYPLGEDGLPNFAAEYPFGIDFAGAFLMEDSNRPTRHEGEKVAAAEEGTVIAAVGSHGHLRFDAENSAFGNPGGRKNSERIDDEMVKTTISDETEIDNFALPSPVDPYASVRNVDHLLDTV